MNNWWPDKASRFISRALELLLVQYPARTSLGIVLGIVLDFFSNLFYPLISEAKYVALERIRWWHFISLGILITHLSTIVGFFFGRPYFPEQTESAIRVIENSNLTQAEKRAQYRLLIQTVIEYVALNKVTETKMREVQEQLQSQE